MKRIQLTVAYDGTDFCGWQVQNNGRTVEGVLNEVLSDFLGEEIRVIGASRTDSGVHGMGNLAIFDTQSTIPGDKFIYILNQRLPDDVSIRKSQEVAADFHPRHVNSRKTYEYRILNAASPNPVRRKYTWLIPKKLDVKAMQRAAQYVPGEHDFASFCAAGSQAQTTVRTVYSCDVREEGEEIVIRVTGAGFLYNMVRILAGTLAEIGKGFYPPEQMQEILEACDRTKAGATAPPQGLMLMGIELEMV
jgi:tRNA pseudouridine38-40 synthase